jgi:phosphate transport system substrate-binding protein
MPAHRTARITATSLALALVLVIALGLGGKLLLRGRPERAGPVAAPSSAATPPSDVRGILRSAGSDTMNNLMALWAEGFRQRHPKTRVEHEGKGSSTAPPALTAGSAHLGPMIRPMKEEEIDSFERKFGHEPTAVKVALDVLAVYVHKENPIESLSLQHVDAIFSKTRRGGHPGDIKTWGDLGLSGEWKDKPIRLYGRNSASGTYGHFKEYALFKGDYKDEVREQPGSSALVQAVASDRYGIGYSGIGYRTPDVRALSLPPRTGGFPFDPTIEHALSGAYPLSRHLLLYFNKSPSRPLDPLRLEFLRFVLSRDGQEAVVKDGYIPLPAATLAEERTKLGGDPRDRS